MDFEQLRQLETIERCGTISAAADELHITQPSLSRSVQRLEADLGQKLFDRTPNRVTFNDAGELALKHAKRILAEEQSMRDAFDDLSRRQRTLRVATVAPAPSWHLTSIVVMRFPGTILNPEIMSDENVRSELINRACDLAITLSPIELPGIVCTPLMAEDLALFTPHDSPFAQKESVSFSELDGRPFLVFEQIGFWMNLCNKKLPNSQLIIQKDRTVFVQLLASTKLDGFTSNAAEPTAILETRVRVPIEDAEAHVMFYLCSHEDASERVRQIAEAVAVAQAQEPSQQ